MKNIDDGRTQKNTQGTAYEERGKTPQYEYARKEVDSWPAWKREISMSGLAINYRQEKKA